MVREWAVRHGLSVARLIWDLAIMILAAGCLLYRHQAMEVMVEVVAIGLQEVHIYANCSKSNCEIVISCYIPSKFSAA